MEVIFIEGKIDMEKNINLLNDDCIEIMKYIPDKSINMIFTDLPYN